MRQPIPLWHLTWISLDAGVRKGKHQGVDLFDGQQFLDRLLHSNNRARDKAALLAEIEKFRPMLPEDPRHAMQGRDLIDLLHIFVRRLSRQRWLSMREAVLGSLASAVRLEHLEHEDMVRALAARVKGT